MNCHEKVVTAVIGIGVAYLANAAADRTIDTGSSPQDRAAVERCQGDLTALGSAAVGQLVSVLPEDCRPYQNDFDPHPYNVAGTMTVDGKTYPTIVGTGTTYKLRSPQSFANLENDMTKRRILVCDWIIPASIGAVASGAFVLYRRKQEDAIALRSPTNIAW